jgi:hypothetical protein
MSDPMCARGDPRSSGEGPAAAPTTNLPGSPHVRARARTPSLTPVGGWWLVIGRRREGRANGVRGRPAGPLGGTSARPANVRRHPPRWWEPKEVSMGWFKRFLSGRGDTTDALRAALAEAEAKYTAAVDRIPDLTNRRAAALLDDDDKTVDAIERDQAATLREADRLEAAITELQRRLVAAEADADKARQVARRDEAERAGAEAERLLREHYIPKAEELAAVLAKIHDLECRVDAFNSALGYGQLPQLAGLPMVATGRARVQADREEGAPSLPVPSVTLTVVLPHPAYHVSPVMDGNGRVIWDEQRAAALGAATRAV